MRYFVFGKVVVSLRHKIIIDNRKGIMFFLQKKNE